MESMSKHHSIGSLQGYAIASGSCINLENIFPITFRRNELQVELLRNILLVNLGMT